MYFCLALFFASHSLRRWLKINLKFYDVTNWRNKNLKTIDISRKKEGLLLKHGQLINFYGRGMSKMCSKGSSRTNAKVTLLKIRYFEIRLSKKSKKVSLAFSFNLVSFLDKIIKNKRDLELVTSFSSSCKIYSEKYMPSIIWAILMI